MSKDQQYDTLPVATQVARDFIDVHKGGLTFRLRIHCDRYAPGSMTGWRIAPQSGTRERAGQLLASTGHMACCKVQSSVVLCCGMHWRGLPRVRIARR
jgi:hypothetical protein